MGILDSIKKAVSRAVSGAKKAVSSAARSVSRAVSSAARSVSRSVSRAAKNVSDSVKSTVKNIQKAVAPMAEAAVKSAVQATKQWGGSEYGTMGVASDETMHKDFMTFMEKQNLPPTVWPQKTPPWKEPPKQPDLWRQIEDYIRTHFGIYIPGWIYDPVGAISGWLLEIFARALGLKGTTWIDVISHLVGNWITSVIIPWLEDFERGFEAGWKSIPD